MTNTPVVAGWTAAVQGADRWASVFAVDDAWGQVEGVAGGWKNVGEHIAPRSEGIEAV